MLTEARPFYVVHAMMAFAASGRTAAAARLLEALSPPDTSGVPSLAQDALAPPFCEALMAFARGDYAACVEWLVHRASLRRQPCPVRPRPSHIHRGSIACVQCTPGTRAGGGAGSSESREPAQLAVAAAPGNDPARNGMKDARSMERLPQSRAKGPSPQLDGGCPVSGAGRFAL